MTIFLWVLVGAAAGLAIGELFFNDDEDSTSSEPPSGEGEIVQVGNALDAIGTDGDDAFVYAPDASGAVTSAIDAGAGNDMIDLASLFNGPGLVGSSVLGGTGDDQISVRGGENTISGGEGNDTIATDSPTSTINGDAGDDVIRATNVSADASNVDGGTGNDTIDVTGSDNINVTGGEGDDVLFSDGRTITGTGYAINIDGGEGNDTLNHSADVFPLPLQSPSENGAILTGGAGTDTFNIELTTGNGTFSATPEDPAVYQNAAAVLTDFERGTDVLEVDIPASLSSYDVNTGTLTEDATAGTTTLSFELTSDTLPTQNFSIVVNTTGLAWSDVAFVDQTPASLLVA